MKLWWFVATRITDVWCDWLVEIPRWRCLPYPANSLNICRMFCKTFVEAVQKIFSRICIQSSVELSLWHSIVFYNNILLCSVELYKVTYKSIEDCLYALNNSVYLEFYITI